MEKPSIPSQIGKYPIKSQIGKGATSAVYLGSDPFSNRSVAIKVMRPEFSQGPEVAARYQKVFLNEASLAGKLMHPHIAAIYDAVTTDDYCYLVMEYVDGVTLDKYCRVASLLPLDKVVEIIFKCARALEYAYEQGVIHRDIKPGNILIGEDGNIKISDFGSAIIAENEITWIQGIGSPPYMSPEQIQEKPLNHQTDIYSLGVVLYKMLTGRLPFEANKREALIYQILHADLVSPQVHRADLPRDLEVIVLKALAREKQERYASWQEFSKDLTRFFRNLNLPTDHLSDTEKFNVVRSLHFFDDFNDVQIWEVLRLSEWERIDTSIIIMQEGDPEDSLYVLARGQVSVSKNGVILNTLHSGDCFGEMLYFANTKTHRNTTITAAQASVAIRIRAQSLRLASDACQVEFNKAFMRLLIDRLGNANERLAQFEKKQKKK